MSSNVWRELARCSIGTERYQIECLYLHIVVVATHPFRLGQIFLWHAVSSFSFEGSNLQEKFDLLPPAKAIWIALVGREKEADGAIRCGGVDSMNERKWIQHADRG